MSSRSSSRGRGPPSTDAPRKTSANERRDRRSKSRDAIRASGITNQPHQDQVVPDVLKEPPDLPITTVTTTTGRAQDVVLARSGSENVVGDDRLENVGGARFENIAPALDLATANANGGDGLDLGTDNANGGNGLQNATAGIVGAGLDDVSANSANTSLLANATANAMVADCQAIFEAGSIASGTSAHSGLTPNSQSNLRPGGSAISPEQQALSAQAQIFPALPSTQPLVSSGRASAALTPLPPTPPMSEYEKLLDSSRAIS